MTRGCCRRKPCCCLRLGRLLECGEQGLAESVFSNGGLCTEPDGDLGDGDLGDSTEASLEGGLHLLSGKSGSSPGHRAGKVAVLAPAEVKTKEEEGGWRPEADELGHEPLGDVQLSLQFAEAEV